MRTMGSRFTPGFLVVSSRSLLRERTSYSSSGTSPSPTTAVHSDTGCLEEEEEEEGVGVYPYRPVSTVGTRRQPSNHPCRTVKDLKMTVS